MSSPTLLLNDSIYFRRQVLEFNFDFQHIQIRYLKWLKLLFELIFIMKKIELIIYLSICTIVPALVLLEFWFFNSSCEEIGVIEISQEFILFLTILFLINFSNESNKRIAYLFCYFLSILLIRELDFLFDYISHGFWFWIVLVVLFACIYKNYYFRDILLIEFEKVKNTSSFSILLLGFSFLFVFSRLFGTSDLWEIILVDDYIRLVKTVVQEGLELFGYLLIFVAVIFIKLDFKNLNKY